MPGTVKNQLSSFLEYLKFEKRYSHHTVTSYETDLVQLDSYLEAKFGPLDLEGISAPLLRSWLAGLKEEGMNTRSINRKISAVRAFFRYHLRKGSIPKNPAVLLKLMKTSKRLPGFLKEEETEVLMGRTGEGEGWKGRTRQLLLEILYNCGLRVSELVGLREKHIDLRASHLKVLGKGNKERVIPFKQELASHMREYMDAKRRELEKFDADYLFVNEKGKPLNTQYVYRLVKQELSDFRNVTRKSPHLMRHTFATQLANNGADLNAIKELLGHSSLAATQVYTHNTIEKLKDIHKKAHPKA
jgi:integrase/recombinase XerC